MLYRSVFVLGGWVSQPVVGAGPSYVVGVSLDYLLVWGNFTN